MLKNSNQNDFRHFANESKLKQGQHAVCDYWAKTERMLPSVTGPVGGSGSDAMYQDRWVDAVSDSGSMHVLINHLYWSSLNLEFIIGLDTVETCGSPPV